MSVFFFPYQATIVLSLVASLYFPPTALLVGILSDFLYYTYPAFPSATATGVALSVGAYFVRRFIKARIISE